MPDKVNAGAPVPPAHLTVPGQVIVPLPPFTTNNVKPNALPAGGFENVTAADDVNCLLKLFAVDKSIVTFVPEPKLKYVSLNTVVVT